MDWIEEELKIQKHREDPHHNTMSEDYFSRQHRSSSSDPLVPLPEDVYFTPGVLDKTHRDVETSSIISTLVDEEACEHPSSASSTHHTSPGDRPEASLHIERSKTTPPRIPAIVSLRRSSRAAALLPS